MKPLKIRRSILTVSIALVIVVLGFAGGIDINSFRKNYVESLVASYNVAGAEPVRKIEYAVKYGKPINNFYGMTALLQETKSDFQEIEDLRIIMPSGETAYALDESALAISAPAPIVNIAFSNEEKERNNNFIELDNKYHILLQIKDVNGLKIGALDIVLKSSIINDKITDYFNKIIIYLVIIALISICIIVLIFTITPIVKSDGEIHIKKVTYTLIIILAISQICFGLINYNLYRVVYIENSKENTSRVVKVVKRDINIVTQKGAPLKELNGIEIWLNSIVKSVPEVESLYITDMRGEVFYKTKNLTLMQEEIINPMYNYSLPLSGDSTSQKGLVNLVLSRKYIEKKLQETALDAVTVLVISFIFMTEIIIMLTLYLKHKSNRELEKLGNTNEELRLTKIKTIRPIAFIFFFAFSLTTSFIPIVMRGFSNSIPWMSEGLRLSIPSSLEAFGTIIATILTGYIIHKKGWKVPFFYGILIACVGSFLSGIATSGLIFIGARLITGIGYGLSWMAMRGFISSFDAACEQTQGFAALNSGIMSGFNCGVALGAMIAERSSYSFAFYITTFMLILSGFFSYLMMRNMKSEASDEEKAAQIINKRAVLSLVVNKKVLIYILCAIIPASVCTVFLTYLFPVIGREMGISSANIGRAFLVNGLFIVYLGPLFSKYVGAKINIKKSIVIANMVYAAAMIIFGLWENFLVAMLAVILLGFSDSFAAAGQGSYFLSLDAAKKAGNGIALAIYSVFYKIGQMIGPIIFGALVAFGNGIGTLIIGITTILLLFIFAGFSKNKNIEQLE